MIDHRGRLAGAVRRARRLGQVSKLGLVIPTEWSVRPPTGDPVDWWRDERDRTRSTIDSVIPHLDPAAVDTDVAIVCVTNRPGHAPAAIASIKAQTGIGRPQVVVVLNDVVGDPGPFRDGLVGLEPVVVHMPPPVSLGACLNAALTLTAARYVAKFDDDDTYGPWFVRDAVRALLWSGSAVVGKHTYLARVDSAQSTVLRFPGREWLFSGFVAGGTIVMDRRRTLGARFGDSRTGEDSSFLAAVEAAGGLILATGALDFVQARTGENTWTLDDESFMKSSVPVGEFDLRTMIASLDAAT